MLHYYLILDFTICMHSLETLFEVHQTFAASNMAFSCWLRVQLLFLCSIRIAILTCVLLLSFFLPGGSKLFLPKWAFTKSQGCFQIIGSKFPIVPEIQKGKLPNCKRGRRNQTPFESFFKAACRISSDDL